LSGWHLRQIEVCATIGFFMAVKFFRNGATVMQLPKVASDAAAENTG